jgi:hypothetical protein
MIIAFHFFFHDGRKTQRRKENHASSNRTASDVITRLTLKLSGGWSTSWWLGEIASTATELAVFTDLNFVGHLAQGAITTEPSDEPTVDARLCDLVLLNKIGALAWVHNSSNAAADET